MHKILFTNDLHGNDNFYKELKSIAESYKIDVVAISGDLLPKYHSLHKQHEYFSTLRRHLEGIAEHSKVVVTFGNDDIVCYEPMLDDLCNDNIFNVHQSFVTINGYTYVGLPYVPDHPFGLKDWVRRDASRLLNKDQFSSNPAISHELGWIQIQDYKKHLQALPSIEEIIVSKIAQLKTSLDKTIWLTHSPPTGFNLDVVSSGEEVGSKDIANLCTGEYSDGVQPFIVASGHIHESPKITGGMFAAQVDKCTCIQPGQEPPFVSYVIATVHKNKITDLYHPKYKADERE